MSGSDQERVASGPVGKAIGIAKEALGRLAGRDDLAREGRLQQAAAETEAGSKRRAERASEAVEEAQLRAERREVELERGRLEQKVISDRADEEIEREANQARSGVAAQAIREKKTAEALRRIEEKKAAAEEQQAERGAQNDLCRAMREESAAERAAERAELIDPEES